MGGRFDPDVLTPDPGRRRPMLELLEAGLAGVDPERLTAEALSSRAGAPTVVVAIGKAAPAMARGAARVLDVVGGICVTDHPEPVPSTIQLLLGDHPVPGPNSFRAGAAVLATVRSAPEGADLVALVSGGGSALCELPRDGVTAEFISTVSRRLVMTGAAIGDINLVRAHLSAIKRGGVARAAGRPIDTLIVSDVVGGDPWLVASGPTIPHSPDVEGAIRVMHRASIDIPATVLTAMARDWGPQPPPQVSVLADGFDAARAIASMAPPPVRIQEDWLCGDAEASASSFVELAGPGITIGVGETTVDVRGEGSGGRNTHAALVAARMLVGTDDLFAAFATDGVDGSSGSAGAIVDGSTLARGGDPSPALAQCDSAGYLGRTHDLLRSGPTGTNVSDIWVLWRQPNVE